MIVNSIDCYFKVSLEVDIYPPIPPGWMEKARSWDTEQPRATVDPTETFWKENGDKVTCGACFNPYEKLVPQEIKDKIHDLVETDKLRMPHDRLSPSYMGYRPHCTKGVSLEKPQLPITHPYISVAQSLDLRRKEEC